jgi:hypothetical protein
MLIVAMPFLRKLYSTKYVLSEKFNLFISKTFTIIFLNKEKDTNCSEWTMELTWFSDMGKLICYQRDFVFLDK